MPRISFRVRVHRDPATFTCPGCGVTVHPCEPVFDAAAAHARDCLMLAVLNAHPWLWASTPAEVSL